MPLKERLIVSIVNWNGMKYLPLCLESLRGQTFKDFRIYIFDNASTDGSPDWIEKNAPDVTLIRNETNAGFSVGHNHIMRMTDSEYFMPLNFDIVLEPDFLKALIEAADSNPGVGMLSGKLYKLSEGKKTNILDSTGIFMPRAMQAARGEMAEDIGQYDADDSRYIFGPCGAAPLYRRKMLNDIAYCEEYFDEDFVYYVEDVDLAWRAQLAGWDGLFCCNAVGYHERGVTRKESADRSYDYLVIGFGNRLAAVYKNMTYGHLQKYFFKIVLFEAGALLSKHHYPYSVNIKTLLRFIRFLPKMRPKRRFIQERAKRDVQEMDKFFQYENYGLYKNLHAKNVAVIMAHRMFNRVRHIMNLVAIAAHRMFNRVRHIMNLVVIAAYRMFNKTRHIMNLVAIAAHRAINFLPNKTRHIKNLVMIRLHGAVRIAARGVRLGLNALRGGKR